MGNVKENMKMIWETYGLTIGSYGNNVGKHIGKIHIFETTDHEHMESCGQIYGNITIF